ncbi:MAG: Gfo/Idh/MocA family oxidoreductase [Chloroflexota bacterium]
MTLKLAFTGTGYIANIHAAAAQKVAGVGLTAVSNHHPTSRQTFAETFNIPRQYDNVADLLADGDVDAISINTPNALHAPEAIAALEAGVHVLVEKPMAMNAAEAKAMIAASQRSGTLLMVAHCWRFDEEVLWLKQQMEPLGAIIRTKGYGVHVNWGPGGWFTQAALAGGGALADMGIHAIDTARFLLGDPLPQSVFARIGTYYGDYDVDDTGTIVVTWDNGCTSTIESGWWQPYAGGPEASTELYGRFGFGSLFPTRVQVGEETAVNPNFPHPRPIHCPQTMYDAQLAYFIACIRAGQQPTPGGHEGLINMKIVDAAYESSRTGQTIMIR